MSFQYGHFGEGFDIMVPTGEALRFSDFVELRGADITVIKLIEIGEDSYGQSIYSESPREEKAFVERDGGERILQTGTVKAESLRLFMKAWAAVGEEGYDVKVDGIRYHVVALDRTRAYIGAEAVRKA